MAVASLVLGIVGLVGSLFGFGWLAAIIGIVGIILAAIAKKNGQGGTATAGLVLCIITVVWGLLSWILCAACVAGASAGLSGLA